jgi:hypothetical protein
MKEAPRLRSSLSRAWIEGKSFKDNKDPEKGGLCRVHDTPCATGTAGHQAQAPHGSIPASRSGPGSPDRGPAAYYLRDNAKRPHPKVSEAEGCRRFKGSSRC